jgi:carboxypeptidase family protein
MRLCHSMSLLLLVGATAHQAAAPASASIRGRVLDENNTPVAGALVRAASADRHVSAAPIRYIETDQTGGFVLDSLEPGQYRVYAKKEADGYPDLSYRFYSEGVPIPIATASTATPAPIITVRIGPRAAAIHGEITDAGTGAPMDGKARLWRLDNPAVWFERSLPSTYRLLVPAAAPVGIRFGAKGCFDWTYSGKTQFRSGETLGLPVVLARDPSKNLTALSHFDDVGSAYSDAGPLQIQLREVRVDALQTGGPSRPLSVLVTFEPQSGAFSWQVSDAVASDPNVPSRLLAFKGQGAAYLKDGHLVDFMVAQSPARLLITERQGTAADLEAAQARALDAAGDSLDSEGKPTTNSNTDHVLDLSEMTTSLDYAPEGPATLPPPKVVRVQRDANHWVVTLRGLRTEWITLGARYNLITIRKVE